MKGQTKSASKRVNLALQGGGAHGAFSWGVIDTILADGRIDIEAVTGASAGAMNAVALADGLAEGCRDEARERLRQFWESVSKAAWASPFKRTPLDAARGNWNLDHSPTYIWFDILSRVTSPYDINPLNINPLKELVEEHIDFDRVRACSCIKLYIAATNVETGRVKIFDHNELTADHVMASACLPHVFHAVEIDGVPYWDGGYMGNPPLWPLFDASNTDDVIVIQINPIERKGAPRAARDILDRLNEITFNASLLRELRAVDFVSRLLDDGRLEGTGYRRVLIHLIEDQKSLSELGVSSKLNAESAFIELLFEKGQEAAKRWLHENFEHIGERSTIDLRGMFQGEEDALDGYRIKRDAKYQSEDGNKRPGCD